MVGRTPRIFVSSTTSDLGTFRVVVDSALIDKETLPISQAHFEADGRPVVDFLENKIASSDAVICLIGPSYGSEPNLREPHAPRRSYTQLEYDIARRLGKPIFVFLATSECSLELQTDEPAELRELQAIHIAQIRQADWRYMQFSSATDLDRQIRAMRLDSLGLGNMAPRLAAILCVSLNYAARFRNTFQITSWTKEVLQPFHDLVTQTLFPQSGDSWTGSASISSDTECVVQFESPRDALESALRIQRGIAQAGWDESKLQVSIGVHLGWVVGFGGTSPNSALITGEAIEFCRELSTIGVSRQILVTKPIFEELTRLHVRSLQSGAEANEVPVVWSPLGRFVNCESTESYELFEAGAPGIVPLVKPKGSRILMPQEQLEFERLESWRPMVGQEIPGRDGWILTKLLGKGGFGETWLATAKKGTFQRAFKFCTNAKHLPSLRRELTAYRILANRLKSRSDLVKIHDTRFDQPPYFLESEYFEAGDLHDWFQQQLSEPEPQLTLTYRVSLATQIATTLNATHSVGLWHNDVKPKNILVRENPGQPPTMVLADFGIGRLVDHAKAKQTNITIEGFTIMQEDGLQSYSGTPMYQPPGGENTQHTDAYAFGVVLYQLVIGDFSVPVGEGWESQLKNSVDGYSELSSKERAAWTDVLTQFIRGLVTINTDNRIRLEDIESSLAAIDTHVKAAMQQRRMRNAKHLLLTTSIVAIIVIISSWGWYTHYQNKIETSRRQLAVQQEQETLIGCEASKQKYHFVEAVESHNRELVDELTPLDYSDFTLLKASSYFDLSHWKPIPAGSTTQNGGQVERSDNVRVIHLIRKRSVSGDNSKIRVHYFTSGYDIFLRCPNRPFVLRARKDRDFLGGKMQSTAAREIEIDVSDVPYGEPFSIVIEATIWNGFQVNEDRKQWAALLSLDDLGEAELGIRFPENMRPKKQPRLWVYLRGSEKAEAPSELQNYTVFSNSNGWVWRPHDVIRNFVYQFEFDWDYLSE